MHLLGNTRPRVQQIPGSWGPAKSGPETDHHGVVDSLSQERKLGLRGRRWPVHSHPAAGHGLDRASPGLRLTWVSLRVSWLAVWLGEGTDPLKAVLRVGLALVDVSKPKPRAQSAARPSGSRSPAWTVHRQKGPLKTNHVGRDPPTATGPTPAQEVSQRRRCGLGAGVAVRPLRGSDPAGLPERTPCPRGTAPCSGSFQGEGRPGVLQLEVV